MTTIQLLVTYYINEIDFNIIQLFNEILLYLVLMDIESDICYHTKHNSAISIPNKLYKHKQTTLPL